MSRRYHRLTDHETAQPRSCTEERVRTRFPGALAVQFNVPHRRPLHGELKLALHELGRPDRTTDIRDEAFIVLNNHRAEAIDVAECNGTTGFLKINESWHTIPSMNEATRDRGESHSVRVSHSVPLRAIISKLYGVRTIFFPRRMIRHDICGASVPNPVAEVLTWSVPLVVFESPWSAEAHRTSEGCKKTMFP